jgi:FkbM family methyltransferase
MRDHARSCQADWCILARVWNFRPNTPDRGIFKEVVDRNEYRLPDRFTASDVVIDVGAHIGSFAHAVVERGCRQAFCFEPDRDNCRRAEAHLRPYVDAGWVRLSQKAVWRSDENSDQLRFDGYHSYPDGLINTGSGSVLWGTGDAVDSIALDQVIDEITAGGTRRVRLLKLDCEGAEWPILLTSRRLDLVDEIVGEFHELGGPFAEISEERPSTPLVFQTDRVRGFVLDELVRWLTEAGFQVTHHRHGRPDGSPEGLGLFFAVRAPAAA